MVTGIGRLESGSLRTQVYEKIKELILINRLAPGQAIAIDQLADEMGVSHTPIREALAMLELDGLVNNLHHRTPTVTPIYSSDVREVYEMRRILECWAARKAARAFDTAQVSAAEKVLDGIRTGTKKSNYDAQIDADIKFHGLIAEAAGSALFLRAYELISNQSVRIRSLVKSQSAMYIDTIVMEHSSILEAIKGGEQDQAEERMLRHLNSAEARTVKALHYSINGEGSK